MGASGNCCIGDEQKQIDPGTPTHPGFLKLTKTGLYISENLKEILSRSGANLNCTYIPGDREYGNNSLILAAGSSFDPKLFVRFFLIYSFYINKYNSKQSDYQKIFYKLAEKSHPSQEERARLKQFKNLYEKEVNELKKDLVVVNHVFTAKFIIENINQILLGSNDPKDIGHLIFPMARLFNGIKKNYHDNIRNKKVKIPACLFIIAELEDEEKDLIVSMKGKQSCFSFSVFMKGFTSENHARKQFNKIQGENKKNGSNKTVFFFTVNFPFQAEKMETKHDYGFYINPDESMKPEGDVLFNIMNSFKVGEVYSKSQYDLEYGFLPYVYFAKHTERSSNIDDSAIRVFDICLAISSNYLKSQSWLFRIIKEQQDSLKVSRSIIESQTQSHSVQYREMADVQVENIINNYIDEQKYAQALKLADQYKSSYLIRAKKLEVLYISKKYDEARDWLLNIGRDAPRKDVKITQGEEIVEFISAKLMLLEGKQDKAKQKLKDLREKMRNKYIGDFEVIGGEVILAEEELVGKFPPNSEEDDMAATHHKNKITIKKSMVNIRGISTTI